MILPDFKKLEISFNPVHLQQELAILLTEKWISHYRKEHFEGKWALLPLRSTGGHPGNIYASPSGQGGHYYQNTPFLEKSPYLKSVFSWFQCEIGAARFMLLGAGACIKEHSDILDDPGCKEEWRIHIPIQTHEKVKFILNGKKLEMKPGEVWYGNFNLPHKVNNDSPIDRVHLVLDCFVDDWLREQIM